MPRSFTKFSLFLLMCGTVISLCLAGCAHDKTTANEQFLNKWKTIAQKAQGHSPAPVPRVHQRLEPKAVSLSLQEHHVLPTKTVSLRMHNANLVAVLQALGRIANQSILISPTVQGMVNVNIVSQPWDRIFLSILKSNGLSYEWEGKILRVMTVEDIEQGIKLTALKNRQPLATTIVRIRYADASSMKDDLEKVLTQTDDGKSRGTVEVDAHSNALIIQATPDDVRKLVKLAEYLDRPSKQVRLRAHIVETTSKVARDLGIQWGGGAKVANGDNSLFVLPGGTGGSKTSSPITTDGVVPNLNDGKTGNSGHGPAMDFVPSTFPSNGNGLSLGLLFGTIGGNILEAQLSALEEDNKLRILSSPSITTLDNQTAFTENGAEVPYISLDEAGNTNVEWKDAVLRLEITPHVIDDSTLKLKIRVKKDEVDLNNKVQGNPLIVKKQTETTLITRNNETVVISGLTKRTLSNKNSGVPYLKDVPGLGLLFSGDSKSNDLEEVLIFITPNILSQWIQGSHPKNVEELEKEYDEDMKRQEEEKNAAEDAEKPEISVSEKTS